MLYGRLPNTLKLPAPSIFSKSTFRASPSMMVRPFRKGSCFRISTRSLSSSIAVRLFALSKTGLVKAA